MYMYRDQTAKPTSVRRLSHAELAMRAARRIKRTRQKEKAGHVVCHHLLRMLESDGEAATTPTDAAATEAREDKKQFSLGF